MKIAIVANTSWNIYNFRMNLIQGFKRQGIEVICVAPEDGFSEYIRKEGVGFYPVTIQSKGSNPMKDILLIAAFRKIYAKVKPDIILHYTIKPNIYGTLAARLCGIPVINTVTGLGTVFLHHNLTSRIAQGLYTFSFRFADKVLFQNQDDRELFIQKGLVAESRSGLVPGSGIDTTVFYPEEKKVTDGVFRFVMAARLLYDKGIQEYAEACAALVHKYGEKVECHLIGGLEADLKLGISENLLEDWVAKHRLLYHGFASDMKEWYHLADAVVLPSYREGIPRTLLEGAACGKPLIASDVAGCKDVVRDGYNGYLCKVKDFTDLAAKMNALMHAPASEFKQMGDNSRAMAETLFSTEIVFDEYDRLIKKITNKQLLK